MPNQGCGSKAGQIFSNVIYHPIKVSNGDLKHKKKKITITNNVHKIFKTTVLWDRRTGISPWLYQFPTYKYPYEERFNAWKSVLDPFIQEKPNRYIQCTFWLCYRHFKDCYQLPSNRLTGNAIPTLRLHHWLQPSPFTSAASAPPLPSHNNNVNNNTSQPCHAAGVPTADAPADAGAELDDNQLEILGDDPSQAVLNGKLQHIATSGLTNDTRKELLDKYLVPRNCTSIGAPALNPEVKAEISEAVLRQDEASDVKQRQLASAKSHVPDGLTILMYAALKNTTNNIKQEPKEEEEEQIG